jgi:hypothetical protein
MAKLKTENCFQPSVPYIRRYQMSKMEPIIAFPLAAIVDLTRPSLAALAYALRHRETWPAGFVWNYRYADTCALGLSHQLWGSSPPYSDTISYRAFSKIFLRFGPLTVIFGRRPTKVADDIDSYLRRYLRQAT